MTGSELVRRVMKHGKKMGIEVRFESRPGKGSHGRLYFGNRFTTVKDRRQEIGKGRRRNNFNTEGGIVTPVTRRATEAYPAYSDGSATKSEVMKLPPNVKLFYADPKGLLHAMLSQLNLSIDDIE